MHHAYIILNPRKHLVRWLLLTSLSCKPDSSVWPFSSSFYFFSNSHFSLGQTFLMQNWLLRPPLTCWEISANRNCFKFCFQYRQSSLVCFQLKFIIFIKYCNCIVRRNEILPEPEGFPEGSGNISSYTLTQVTIQSFSITSTSQYFFILTPWACNIFSY